MIIDKFENLPLYFSCLPRLDRAAEFLAGENIADGHYEIDGEKIFANVSSYEPKEFNGDMRFEAHKKYAISRRFSRAKSASTGRRSARSRKRARNIQRAAT